MKPWIMFTKHLQGWDVGQIITGLKQGGVQGADLCVRPGYPVTPANARRELPAVARRFADEGLCIPLVTTPADFVRADLPDAEPLFAACAEAGVGLVKLGYWHMEADGYWPTLDRCRRQLEGFSRLAEQTGVKAIVHNHSGASMGLNSAAMMHLVSGSDPRHIGVFADVGHLSIVGEPYPMAFSMVKDYLAAVALKDLVRRRAPDGSWAIDVWPMGMGFGDFPLALRVLKQLDFAGPLSFHCEYASMPHESLIHQLAIDTRFIAEILAGLA